MENLPPQGGKGREKPGVRGSIGRENRHEHPDGQRYVSGAEGHFHERYGGLLAVALFERREVMQGRLTSGISGERSESAACRG